MLSFTLTRPRVREWRDRLLALAVPLAALAALLALGGDRGYFYRDVGIHNVVSIRYISIAENLSPKHNFRLASRIWPHEDGEFRYSLFGRYLIGGYALVKLALSPFGDDIAAKLLAARVLVLLMFCGAALSVYLSIFRITGIRTVALGSVALGFSGLYAIYYADMVFSQASMDLFGAALTFHGMTVFVQEGRFRQLAVKACAALLLGWHVYALLLPFIALGLGGEAVALLRSAISADEKMKAARSAPVSLVRSRFAALAAVSILFGSALLSFNIVNEYAARRETGRTLSESTVFQSMMGKLSQRDSNWGVFFERQFFYLGVMVTPHALARAVGYDFPTWEGGAGTAGRDTPLAPVVLGAAAAGAALAGAALARRYRILAMTAVLFGFCWTIPVRDNAGGPNHLYEALWYIGIGLTLFTLALVGARLLLGGRAALGICAAAALVFAASVFYAGRIDRDPREAERDRIEMADAQTIREIAGGDLVRVVPMRDAWSRRRLNPWVWRFYLSGGYSKVADCASADDAGFTVAPYRHESLDLLTPENRVAFLYRETSPLEICRAERRRLESSEPAARAAFDVYLRDETITYLKAPCSPADRETPFYGYVHPADMDDLPARHKHDGIHPTYIKDPKIVDIGAVFDGACLMTLQLPAYPIAAVETGQRVTGVKTLWKVWAAPPPDAEALAFYEDAYRAAAASGEPAVRSEFDLYADGGALRYLKEPCAEGDARGRFFLSVHPADAGDLPAERRDIGHESLNFTFAPPFGAFFNGKCMASRELPDYPISRIETGQWTESEGVLWSAEIQLDGYYERYREALAPLSGEPAMRSDFDVYMEGGTLTYVKEVCSESDARGRFFLSVFPADANDLPQAARDAGSEHEALNFDFQQHGAVFDGKCVVIRDLPDYPISRIETGQWTESEGELWSAGAAVGD